MSLLETPQPFREGTPTLFESMADGRVEKYQASLLYGQSVEDLQNGEARMDTFQGYAERIGRHQSEATQTATPYTGTKHLRCLEATGSQGAWINEEETRKQASSGQLMKINGPYASLLTIDHSISQVSWPSRTTSVYAWCEAFAIPANYERGNLARHCLLRLNGLLAVVLLEPDRLRPN